MNGPHLNIIEEPKMEFRFRYKTEVKATYGSLQGQSSIPSEKVFPTVELCNYNADDAIIRCSLFQADTLSPSLHVHKLITRHKGKYHTDPHVLKVSPGSHAVFRGLSICHTPRKEIVEVFVNKKLANRKLELGRDLTDIEKRNLTENVNFEIKDINLNLAVLGFEAFRENEDGSLTQICDPVFSCTISNLKSCFTGNLKICRLSRASSFACGHRMLTLLVEKVGKTDIKVRFYEENEDDELVWEDWGIFSPRDVHHQYAITLKTPPYKNPNIKSRVWVKVQLIRTRDNKASIPAAFMYIPNKKPRRIEK